MATAFSFLSSLDPNGSQTQMKKNKIHSNHQNHHHQIFKLTCLYCYYTSRPSQNLLC
jgi:hypothetical protein